MSESQFDPNTFLDATTTEAATRRPPLPVENPVSPDGLYQGILGEPKFRSFAGTKDPSKTYLAFDIPVTIEVPSQLQDSMKLQPQVQLTGGGFVDVTEAGMLDWSPGKNGTARRYREATGTNVAGQTFNFRMLAGKPVRVKIVHDVYQGDIVDKIGNVLKM